MFIPPPSLNNVYIQTEMRLAYGGTFGVIDSADAILDASTGLAI